jgi:pimeloyl-ACP methyl ester carboxylesterase
VDGTPGSVLGTDGTRIGFRTAGAGPALLLVHGGMCSAERWAPLWRVLVGRFEVTAMDRRGRASSPDTGSYSLAQEYADVSAVAEHLAERRGSPVDVFGHSYGAVCVLGAAARGAPVRRLALYEPPGPQTLPPGWLERMRVLVDRRELGRAMFSFLVEVVGLSREQVEELRDGPRGADPMPIVEHTLVREAEALQVVDLAALGAEVRQPVLLLLGADSPPWAAAGTDLVARAASAEVAVLAEQGHEAVDQAPALVAGVLERFLLDDPGE